MLLQFHKYQGAGNDFVLFDDRQGQILPLLDEKNIARLCDRHFGIGADGLMLLRHAVAPYDFEMLYYNSDGRPGSMCGNGGRCIVRFAAELGIDRTIYRFLAVDGPHEATLTPAGEVALGMNDVSYFERHGADYVLDTGSPHYLQFVPSLEEVNVVQQGRAIRQSAPFAAKGINVNFVRETHDGLELATYERGVEDETLACGTGVTAAAMGLLLRSPESEDGSFHIPVRARGGQLYVTGERHADRFTHLQLVGPAERVFTGQITL